MKVVETDGSPGIDMTLDEALDFVAPFFSPESENIPCETLVAGAFDMALTGLGVTTPGAATSEEEPGPIDVLPEDSVPSHDLF